MSRKTPVEWQLFEQQNLFFSLVDVKQIGGDRLLERGLYRRDHDRRLYAARFRIGMAFFDMSNVKVISDELKRRAKGRQFGLIEFSQFMVDVYEAYGLPLEGNPSASVIASMVKAMNARVVRDTLKLDAAKPRRNMHFVERTREKILPRYDVHDPTDHTLFLVDPLDPLATFPRLFPRDTQQERQELSRKKARALQSMEWAKKWRF